MDVERRVRSATGFEWEAGNADKHWLTHGVSVAQCEQVFSNQSMIVAADEAHSRAEPHFFVLGQTNSGREMFVAFTLRGDVIRVISARDMSRRERKVYHSHG